MKIKLLISSFIVACALLSQAQNSTNIIFSWEKPLPTEKVFYWEFLTSPTNKAWTNITITLTNNVDLYPFIRTQPNDMYITKVVAVGGFSWSTNATATNAVWFTNFLRSDPSAPLWLFWNAAPSAPTNRVTSFGPPPLPE